MKTKELEAMWRITKVRSNGETERYEATGEELLEEARHLSALTGLKLRRNASIDQVHCLIALQCESSTREECYQKEPVKYGTRRWKQPVSAW